MLLWFFFTWSAAEFCVNTRLKTPLGKALETFQTIEGNPIIWLHEETDLCYNNSNVSIIRMLQ